MNTQKTWPINELGWNEIVIEAIWRIGEEKWQKLILKTIADIRWDLASIIAIAVTEFDEFKMKNPIIKTSNYIIDCIRFNWQIIHILD